MNMQITIDKYFVLTVLVSLSSMVPSWRYGSQCDIVNMHKIKVPPFIKNAVKAPYKN